MTIKKTALSTSIILALGLSTFAFAETKAAEGATTADGTVVEIECISQAEVDLMTTEDKAKLTLPICGADADAEKAVEEPATTATTTEETNAPAQ